MLRFREYSFLAEEICLVNKANSHAQKLYSRNLCNYGTYSINVLLCQLLTYYAWNPVHSFPTGQSGKEFTPDLMFTKYEADLLCQNMFYITTKGRGVRASLPLYSSKPFLCMCTIFTVISERNSTIKM